MASPSEEIQVGTVIADLYEITSLLGRGGMGAVYAARHRRLPGKLVAIKVLHVGLDAQSTEMYARFRREAEIASRLGHPNIVEVLDFHTLPGGTPYLVMEFLRGESLAQRLRYGALPLENVFAITRQIGSALLAAHKVQVVHRDLKPDNIFLTKTEVGGTVHEQVKVLDFGISKIAGSQTLQTMDKVLIGTPQYMAPEQATGKNSQIDARTDIFAVGAIVYEMLSGRAPFAGESLAEILYKVVHAQPEPLSALVPGLPERVVKCVERAMAKAPADRFADVRELVEELTNEKLQTLSDSQPIPVPEGLAPTTPEGKFKDTDSIRFGATAAPGSRPSGPPLELAATQAPPPSRRDATPGSTAGQTSPPLTPAKVRPQVPESAPTAPTAPSIESRSPTAQFPKRSKLPLVAGLVALGGVAVAGWLFVQRPDRAQPSTSTPAPGKDQPAANPTPQNGPGPQAVESSSPDASTAVAVTATPPVEPNPAQRGVPDAGEAGAQALTGTTSRPSPVSGPKERISPEAQALLDKAESLLETDPVAAATAARRSIAAQRTDAALAVLAKSYCRQKDLGNAKSWSKQLPLRQRTAVARYCRPLGVEL